MLNKKVDEYNVLKEVKEWLNRAHNIDKEITVLIQEQDKAFLSATSTVNSTSDERVQTSRKNTSENKYISYASYSELIDKRIGELYETKQEILNTINDVDDSTLRLLLILKYINFYSFEKISETLNYSREWVIRKLHPAALNEIKNTEMFKTLYSDSRH